MIKKIFSILLLLIIIYFPLFLHLDRLPIFLFDESRLAINAWEMSESGNLLMPTFQGETDMWNTKPPLMIWLQSLSIKLFGVNELAIRLPAAIAALLTVLYIGFFCWKNLNRPILGLMAILVLITTPGYITDHVSRTGDYDALLILFLVLFLFTCFRLPYSKVDKEKNKLLILASLWLSLAVLTKGVAGLFFTPAILIYFTWKKYWKTLFASTYTYYAIGLFLLLVGGYYGLRESYNPGYLEAVWQNELGGRYLKIIEDHSAPFWYYFKDIWKWKFLPWIFFLPLVIFLNRFGKQEEQLKDFLLLLGVTTLVFLLLISSAQSKLTWYDAPIYPLLAILVASSLYYIYEVLTAVLPGKKWLQLCIFCITFFGMAYRNILGTVYLPDHHFSENRYREFIRERPQFKTFTMVDLGYNGHILFYEKLLKKEGYNLQRKYPDYLEQDTKALICGEKVEAAVQDLFEYQVLDEWKDCQMLLIKRKL